MKKSHPAVCYYVTGHGLGHASRAMQVMQRIPEVVPLYVKTLAPAHFFRRELKRPFTLIHQGLDTGCWQESNFAVDWDRTFTHAMRVQRQARRQMRSETAFLKSHGVGAVVTDAGAPPLRAAAEAGIPGIAVVNFTWMDIFGRHAAGIAERENLLREYWHDYSLATLALRTPFCFPMRCFRRIRPIPLIARRGHAMRAELRHAVGAGPGDRMVLLYFGNWSGQPKGDPRIPSIPGVVFVSLMPMPAPVKCIEYGEWNFEDVVASVDAVLAKPGYGTLGECMANGRAVVYYPRTDFVEYYRIRADMDRWGGGVRISSRDFFRGHWEEALGQAFALKPAKADSSGAQAAADTIVRMLYGGGA